MTLTRGAFGEGLGLISPTRRVRLPSPLPLLLAVILTGCALFTPPPRVWTIADDDLRAIERSLLVAYGVQKGRVGILCQAMQGSEVCASSLAFLGQLEAAYQATTKALKPGGGPLPPGTLNGIIDLIIKAAPLVGGLAI